MEPSGGVGREASNAQPREVEGTLAVRAEAPGNLLREVADLPRAGGFSLRPRDNQHIRDVYFDTAGGELGRRKVALRLRDLDGAALLALKVDSEVGEFATDRLEIEAPWSMSTLKRITEELRRRGVSVPGLPPSDERGEPVAILATMGFVPLQDRETTRTPRDVIPSGDQESPVAEVAMDAVVYHFAPRAIRFHEIEVEARGRGDAVTVERVTAGLMETFPGVLQRWFHGKLATGNALRHLIGARRLDGLVHDDGTLSLPAYDLLAEYLSQT